LGMGDMLTLIEKAEAVYDEEEAEAAAERILEGEFTLEDFLQQMQQLKKMGPLNNLLGMMPGMPKELKNQEIDDRQVARVEAIIRSMTPKEREKPDLIEGSRRGRIAAGSGTRENEVSQLINQFKQMQKMLKKMGGMGTKSIKRAKRKGVKGKKTGGRRSGNPQAGRTTPKKGEGKRKLVLPGLDELEQNEEVAALLNNLK
jgi:signal recognition particle subunit SRP54